MMPYRGIDDVLMNLSRKCRRKRRFFRSVPLFFCAVVIACVLPAAAAFSTQPASSSYLFSSSFKSVPTLNHRTSILLNQFPCRRHQPSATTSALQTASQSSDSSSSGVGISTTDKILVAVMAALSIFALGELMEIAGAGSWRYFLAGGICASTSHAITTPIDVVKVCSVTLFLL